MTLAGANTPSITLQWKITCGLMHLIGICQSLEANSDAMSW